MAVETIDLIVGQEQTFNIDYNDVQYDFALSFNDFHDYWIMDISSNGVDVITGLPMKPGLDVLSGFEYLMIGRFFLIDTEPLSTIALDVKRDLGDRLKLVRDYE